MGESARGPEEPGERVDAIVQPRKDNRYQIGVPVIFSWKDVNEVRQQAVGLSRDISVRGAFVFTTSPPPLEARVKLKICLPLVGEAVQPAHFYGQGKVVRVDIADGETRGGFAMVGKPFVARKRGERQ
jgi:hypothetical protein